MRILLLALIAGTSGRRARGGTSTIIIWVTPPSTTTTYSRFVRLATCDATAPKRGIRIAHAVTNSPPEILESKRTAPENVLPADGYGIATNTEGGTQHIGAPTAKKEERRERGASNQHCVVRFHVQPVENLHAGRIGMRQLLRGSTQPPIRMGRVCQIGRAHV